MRISRTREAMLVVTFGDRYCRGVDPLGSAALMEGSSIQEHRLRRVQEAFATLPERYLGGEEGRNATVQIRLSDIGRTWEVEVHPERCKVRTSPSRKPDVVIGTDAGTWLALREGRLSGLDAFQQRRLWARGDLDVRGQLRGPLPAPRRPSAAAADPRRAGARGADLQPHRRAAATST